MSAANGSTRNGSATNGHNPLHLSVEQENAINLLLLGKTDAEVAEGVGVHRVTVTKWRNKHPAFQAELNRRRQEVWEAAIDQVRSLVPKAVAVIAGEFDGGKDRLRAALEVLKLATAYRERQFVSLTRQERESRIAELLAKRGGTLPATNCHTNGDGHVQHSDN
jgi:hypothetical protein